MKKSDGVWPASHLTEGDDLEKMKETLDWVRSWDSEEAVRTFTHPIHFYNFFIQFKDMTLASYQFDTWVELEGVLYDNHIMVSAQAGFVGGSGFTFHSLKYDNLLVGYAVRGDDRGEYYAHASSRFEVRDKI